MSLIDMQMSEDMAKEQAKKQMKCSHQFEVRHIELLDEDVEICSKCDINLKLYYLSISTPCFGEYRWHQKNCWVCNLSLLCQAKKNGGK